MKALDLVERLVKMVSIYGNKEICIDLLTENQSNRFEIKDVENYGEFDIIVEIEDIKKFKKKLK